MHNKSSKNISDKLIREAREGHFNVGVDNTRSLQTSHKDAYGEMFDGTINERDLDFDGGNFGIQKGTVVIGSGEKAKYKVP